MVYGLGFRVQSLARHTYPLKGGVMYLRCIQREGEMERLRELHYILTDHSMLAIEDHRRHIRTRCIRTLTHQYNEN